MKTTRAFTQAIKPRLCVWQSAAPQSQPLGSSSCFKP